MAHRKVLWSICFAKRRAMKSAGATTFAVVACRSSVTKPPNQQNVLQFRRPMKYPCCAAPCVVFPANPRRGRSLPTIAKRPWRNPKAFVHSLPGTPYHEKQRSLPAFQDYPTLTQRVRAECMACMYPAHTATGLWMLIINPCQVFCRFLFWGVQFFPSRRWTREAPSGDCLSEQ